MSHLVLYQKFRCTSYVLSLLMYCRSAKNVIETFFFARPILVQFNSIEKPSTDPQLWYHQFIVVAVSFLRMALEGINEFKF